MGKNISQQPVKGSTTAFYTSKGLIFHIGSYVFHVTLQVTLNTLAPMVTGAFP